MKLSLFSSIAIFAASTNFASAGSTYIADPKQPIAQPPVLTAACFLDNETSIDLFGAYVFTDGDGLEDSAGGGIGINQFYNKFFGVGLDAYWWDGNSAIHSVNASAILRAPIGDSCFAPYVFGGVGGHFDSVNQVTGFTGAGFEYRLTSGESTNYGIFTDARYTFADETSDYVTTRLGIRIIF